MKISSVVLFVLMVGGLLAACTQPDSQSPEAAASAEAPEWVQGDSINVHGVLIDSRCFALDKDNIANDHVKPEGQVRGVGCGGTCAKQGFPVAVLTDGDATKTVWILSFPPAVFADYIGRTVRVLGDYRAPSIIVPLRMEYKQGDSWTRIM